MSIIKKSALSALVITLLTLTACTPEVGSDAWCTDMKEKSKADWTANQTSDFAKNCVFK
ncbi:MAG: hypothetical protein ACJA2Y_000668 [Cycloclasticus pugetii]|jgi:hypothetical protein|uniref:DUF3012 domain-containing protein n=1 Tax=Cycloclasticus pugetii TaxID=34068 RepID=A0AB33Z1P0_9GAMM|nr:MULTISPECIES: DUF3012 domain-containing protein [Cycloclasticus]ATI02027.1 DUF3012 domain-containing protein [Cycloclasticus sp. PY97N]EPD13230.1 hypothetical protein L196_06295 [Cycloclasticus pugetii]MBV1899380.1 DUF3012 domain-containing protein [Cycloclasticus sp.]MDF1829420.1 DUF3012 domain-containing protein [Cycloclasticus pugetii]PHR50338.1 MAG: DUF3012 domain-containing protein [Cycloclasticus sp.]|tara:strand:- start:2659 stop:2835 length:177 start_codon:yes stop_codon:yes gene_type:complete